MTQWIQLKISKIVERITKISIEGTSIKCLHQSIVYCTYHMIQHTYTIVTLVL